MQHMILYWSHEKGKVKSKILTALLPTVNIVNHLTFNPCSFDWLKKIWEHIDVIIIRASFRVDLLFFHTCAHPPGQPLIQGVVVFCGGAVHLVPPVTDKILLVEHGLIVAEEGVFGELANVFPLFDASVENLAVGLRVPIEPIIHLPLAREIGLWDGVKGRIVLPWDPLLLSFQGPMNLKSCFDCSILAACPGKDSNKSDMVGYLCLSKNLIQNICLVSIALASCLPPLRRMALCTIHLVTTSF